jgi:hypothetical protein
MVMNHVRPRPRQVYHEEQYLRLKFADDTPWGTVLDSTAEAFGLTVQPPEARDYRLCRLDLIQNVPGTAIITVDDTPLAEVPLVSKLDQAASCRLVLETRTEGDARAWEVRGPKGPWAAAAAGEHVVQLQLYDTKLKQLLVDDVHIVRFTGSATVGDLHAAVAEIFELEPEIEPQLDPGPELETESELEPEPQPQPEPQPEPEPEPEPRRKPKHGYSLQGDAAGVDLMAVDGILADRVQAKRAQDYTLCDELRAVLKNGHQVLIDDKTWTWRVMGGKARPAWSSVAFHTIVSSNCCARCAS